ncbi:MAG TPA: hypothetical protein VIJ21_01360 [Solirubrobacterales bacterium]
MRRLNMRRPRTIGLLALALGAVAVLAMSGIAVAKDNSGEGGHNGRHHHHHHHFASGPAGTVSSFDVTTGKLTIALTGGESVTGLVTEDTQIQCESFEDHRSLHRDHGGSGGDNNGGQSEPGDDNGEPEPGDDNGNDGPGETEGPTEAEMPPCSEESVVAGATVAEAQLELEGGSAVFKEIELGEGS